MRTLEDIERDLEKARKEAEPLIKAREEAVGKCNLLLKEKEQYKIDHVLFHPMSELEKHKGKKIVHIKLVEKSQDGKLCATDMWIDELFSVDSAGHLDYSSYNYGIMQYREKKQKYIYSYYGLETERDFVGYLDVEFEEEDEE